MTFHRFMVVLRLLNDYGAQHDGQVYIQDGQVWVPLLADKLNDTQIKDLNQLGVFTTQEGLMSFFI